MIYDCFTFFNELELLEIRLNELDPVVDYFVLVEATYTFQNKPKKLFFEENKNKFEKFKDKIIHIILEERPTKFTNAWDLEYFQRNAILKGLQHAKPGDEIIISDIDEIPNPIKIKEYNSIEGFKIFQQRLFYYFLNCIDYQPLSKIQKLFTKKEKLTLWNGSVMVSYKDLKSPQECRDNREGKNKKIKNIFIPTGGWHFSYLGGVEKIIYKIESFAHAEFNNETFKDPKKIEEYIENGMDLFSRDNKYKFIEIDNTFPRYIIANQNKFENLIYKKRYT